MKRISLFVLVAAVAVCSFAAAPNGSGTYYKNANGKKGSDLKTALCGIIYNRTAGTIFRTEPFPSFVQQIIAHGGLVQAIADGVI